MSLISNKRSENNGKNNDSQTTRGIAQYFEKISQAKRLYGKSTCFANPMGVGQE